MQKSDFTNMRHHSVPCHSWAFHLPGCGGRADGVHLPAFTACKLRALVIQEGARLLLRSSVWGGGRDSASAGVGVDIFMQK